jgi:amidohydrolase
MAVTPGNTFLKTANDLAGKISDLRRDFHRHPELGMQETRTSGIVAEHCRNLGLDLRTKVGNTGVVAVLHGKKNGPCVAIRADMDALPMTDDKTVPYASSNPGIAHACGHDANTAILMGAAEILTRHSDLLQGNVKFIFQPSEDTVPGGALPMIKDGALENPSVQGLLSSHLMPDYDEGEIIVKSGYSTISSAGFTLKMLGKGGHPAYPQLTNDPVVMAGHVITAAQSIVSRRVDPQDPTILCFGSVHGGTAGNIIPDEVVLTGTIRTLKPEARDELAALLDEIAAGAAKIGGGRHALEVQMEYPSVYNHPGMVDEFLISARKVATPDQVIHTDRPTMSGEDVSYFHQQAPGVRWLLGIRNKELGFMYPLHSPLFDFNETVMPLAAAVHAQAAADFLVNRLEKEL